MYQSLFTHPWAQLLPSFDIDKWSHCKHPWAGCVLTWVYRSFRSTIVVSYCKVIFNFKATLTLFTKIGFTNLYFQQQWIRVSVGLNSFGIVSIFDLSYFNRCVVVFYCVFFLICNSLNNMWYRVSFYMLIFHHIFFAKVSLQIFCPFFKWIFFLWLSFKCSLYILGCSTLSDISLKIISFSPWLVFWLSWHYLLQNRRF